MGDFKNYDLEGCLDAICLDLKDASLAGDVTLIDMERIDRAIRAIRKASGRIKRAYPRLLDLTDDVSYWYCPFRFQPSSYFGGGNESGLLLNISKLLYKEKGALGDRLLGGEFDSNSWTEILKIKRRSEYYMHMGNSSKEWEKIVELLALLLRLTSDSRPLVGYGGFIMGFSLLLASLVFALSLLVSPVTYSMGIGLIGLIVAVVIQAFGLLYWKRSVSIGLRYCFDMQLISQIESMRRFLSSYIVFINIFVTLYLTRMGLQAGDRLYIGNLPMAIVYIIGFVFLPIFFLIYFERTIKILEYWASRQTKAGSWRASDLGHLGPRVRR